MLDIYNIPLYYISFNKSYKFEKNIRIKGFKKINFFKAIDGRKLKISDLKKDGIISIRSYNDLVNSREQHSGISSLGAIGCSLSHYYLWQKCIKMNLKYIIIVEDDIDFDDEINKNNLNFINECLKKPKSAFFGTSIKKNNNIKQMWGTQFCILSNNACKELVKNIFPIDVQVDSYISHMADIGSINICAKPITKQKQHASSIQDSCIKCNLPNNNYFYYGCVIIFIIAILIIIFLAYKYIKCKKNI